MDYHRRRAVGKMNLKLLRSVKHLDFVKAILRAKIVQVLLTYLSVELNSPL